MAIGIICAMPQEIAALQQDMQSEQTVERVGRTFYQGKLYGQSVVLVMSHIGKVATAITTTLLLEQFDIHCVVFSGTAGGIAPDLSVGDIVIADQCVQHDFSVDSTPTFRIPMLEQSYFVSEERLVQQLTVAANQYLTERLSEDLNEQEQDRLGIVAPKAVVGTIASGDQFIADETKSKWLYQYITNLQCVEMEGAAMAQVCYEYHIPFAVMRVLSDGANQNSFVSFDEFIHCAARYYTRGVLREWLCHDPLHTERTQ